MSPWIAWGTVVVLIMAREIYRWQRNVRLSRMLERLHWREEFARTRSDVVRLIHSRELEPDSLVAQSMYVMSSAMVRRASDYRGFTHAVVMEALRQAGRDDHIGKRMKHEVRNLQPQARESFMRFIDDIEKVLLKYSWLYRTIAAFAALNRMVRPSSKPVIRPRSTPWPKLDEQLRAYRRTTELRRLATAA